MSISSLPTKKAMGQCGQFYATIDGMEYPTCGHLRVKKNHYSQYHEKFGEKAKLMAMLLIKTQKVILTFEESFDNGKGGLGFNRLGYVGLFKIDNLSIKNKTIEFDIVERIYNLK